jgi:hypothetical protein
VYGDEYSDRPKSIEINNVLYCRLAGRVDKIV